MTLVREFSTREAAEELRTDRNRITILIRRGYLKARRKYPNGKGHWLISEQAIADYRRSLTHRSAA